LFFVVFVSVLELVWLVGGVWLLVWVFGLKKKCCACVLVCLGLLVGVVENFVFVVLGFYLWVMWCFGVCFLFRAFFYWIVVVGAVFGGSHFFSVCFKIFLIVETGIKGVFLFLGRLFWVF
jgi:hypothetical protein